MSKAHNIYNHFSPSINIAQNEAIQAEVDQSYGLGVSDLENNSNDGKHQARKYQKQTLEHVMGMSIAYHSGRNPNSPRTAVNKAVVGFSLDAGMIALRTLVKGNLNPCRAV